jgi:CRISPR-associated protein Cas1
VTRRIIDVSGESTVLSLQSERIVLRFDRGEEVAIPISDVEALLVSSPHMTMSVRALAKLSAAGVSTVISDETHRPTGIVLPIVDHGKIASRFAAQATMKRPVRKKLWRQVVRAKIRNQAGVLVSLGRGDHGLNLLCKEVRSGDPTNVEAQAAIRYWKCVFGDGSFRRDPALGGRNACLNYGYAVVRASVARAICGAGLHPALGIHHHSRGNPLCLADDLMEPFRPAVDMAVAEMSAIVRDGIELDKDCKRRILTALSGRFEVDAEHRTLFDLIERMVQGMARVVDGSSDRLWVPRFSFGVTQ